MIQKRIFLDLDYDKMGVAHDGFAPYFDTYIPDFRGNSAGKAIVICPGGGYSFVSDREAEPIALAFAEKGVATFVLNYSVAPNRYPTQLLEVAKTISIIKQNAEEFAIDKESLYVCGFSAGGHLAGSYCVKFATNLLTQYLGGTISDYSVSGGILGYPVVTNDTYAEQNSMNNLLGDKRSELGDSLSIEKQVTATTPRMFIWHTANDGCVPAMNSLLLALSLAKNKVPYELHIYQSGNHGLSLANDLVGYDNGCSRRIRGWVADAYEWLLETTL